jgi:peptidoglycan/xylan/chitin deacetylase (PgdA/CDA1 family)
MTELPKSWPDKRNLAVSVSVMLEAWTDDSAPGIGPMGNPLKAGVLDLQGRSWAEYGPKVGAWRILDILADAKVSAVFYVSGILAERYPELLKAIVAAGHEVAAHGWGQNIIPATQAADDEASDLGRCVEVLQRATGRRPRGWLSPRCTPSQRTTDLLVGADFLWHADFFDSDLPRPVSTANGSLVAMPFTMEVNDMPLYVRYGAKPEAYTDILERIVAGWPDLGNRPGCLDITVHAHVFGRPAGALEFARSLTVVEEYADWAWLTNHLALAQMWTADA